jgi:hypothetical protein
MKDQARLDVVLPSARRLLGRVDDILPRGVPGVPVMLSGTGGRVGLEPREVTDGKGLVEFLVAPAAPWEPQIASSTWIASTPPERRADGFTFRAELRRPGHVTCRVDLRGTRGIAAPGLLLAGPGGRHEIVLEDGEPRTLHDLAPGPYTVTLRAATSDGRTLLAEQAPIWVASQTNATASAQIPERWRDGVRFLPLVGGVVAGDAIAIASDTSRANVETANRETDGVLSFRSTERFHSRNLVRPSVLVLSAARGRAALLADPGRGPGVTPLELPRAGAVRVDKSFHHLRAMPETLPGVWFDLSRDAFVDREEDREFLLPAGTWTLATGRTNHGAFVVDPARPVQLR